MAQEARYVPDPDGMRKIREAVGVGLLNYLFFGLEPASKANAPVRGGHRSFAPDGPVGGTLRRSVHSVVFVDGRRIGGATTDGNRARVPDYPLGGADVLGVVGTNVGYGLWVHNGTVYMTKRPFILEALAETKGEAPGLIEDGMRKALR